MEEKYRVKTKFGVEFVHLFMNTFLFIWTSSYNDFEKNLERYIRGHYNWVYGWHGNVIRNVDRYES